MEKKDLKTLALLGMAGGLLLSAQAINANESVEADYSSYLAASGCASCGSHKGKQAKKNAKDSEVADTYQPSGHGCGGYSDPSYYNQPSGAGCGGQQPNYYNQPSGASHGCGGRGGQTYYDPSVSQNNNGQWTEVQRPSNYSQQQGQGQYQYQQTSQPQQYGSGSTTSQGQYQPQTSTKTYK